jgi:UDP-glucose 4-epimerase
MNTDYLRELIHEVQSSGGVMLSLDGKTEAVVLTIDRYNQLTNKTHQATDNPGTTYKVLVTGGAGYIGTHLCRELLKAGHQVVIIDNLSSGQRDNVPHGAKLEIGDIRDPELVSRVLREQEIQMVFHLAASIEAAESVEFPEGYFDNNTLATASLLSVMAECGVKKIIFSSTAAVYGEQEIVPIPEDAPLRPNNPYGYTKVLAEHFIHYYCDYLGFQAVIFRYFNACGTDPKHPIVSAHQSHLIPSVMEVVAGRRDHLTVNGNDYETFDGTCIRDYVHVLDIAQAHVQALEKMAELDRFNVYNIGTAKGLSVEQIITAAAEITGRMIPLEIGPRRPGDAPVTVADNAKIKRELGFELKHSDPETIIRTSQSI